MDGVSLSKCKVYMVNEYEWIAGPDLESVKDWYVSETGCSEAEAFGGDERCPYELGEVEMATMLYDDYAGDLSPSGEPRKYSFAQALAMMESHGFGGDGRPFNFAGTEY